MAQGRGGGPLRSTRVRVVVGVVLVVAVGAAAGTWALTRSSATAASPTESLVAATSGTVRQTVTATGTIEPARQAVLSFTVAGTVSSVPVTVGQAVTTGQALATVGTDTLTAAVTTAQASVTAAQAALTAQLDADGSATQLASARAQLAGAQSKLADARSALAAGTLTSTIDGTVAAVSIAVGDRVSGTAAGGGQSSASTATGTVTVISTDAYVVDAAVGSSDLAQVKKGLQAEITPTGAAQRVFGTVSSVGIIASTSSSTGGTAASATFPVSIAVTGTPTGLYAGGTASVVIVVSQTPDVLTVPTLALHTSGTQTVVYQRRGGRQVSTPVTVGRSFGATTQITEGLAAGDQVVVTLTRPGAGGGTGTTRTRTGTSTGGFGGGTGGFPGAPGEAPGGTG